MLLKDLEEKIIQNINESNLPIDAVYFVMKSIMAESEQRYFEFCRQEDIERAEMVKKELEPDNTNEESNSEDEEAAAANNKEGAK